MDNLEEIARRHANRLITNRNAQREAEIREELTSLITDAIIDRVVFIETETARRHAEIAVRVFGDYYREHQEVVNHVR